MTRLFLCVEGQTEETFVNQVLSPHLYNSGYTLVFARLMGSGRNRRGGGVRPWIAVRREILDNLKQDQGRFVSMMVDYYGMPDDWPGRANPFTAAMSVSDRAEEIEDALLQDVRNEMGTSFNPNRFVPYVMMHEFEAMLFSDCDSFGHAIGRSDLIDDFQEIRDDFTSPEEIDDSPINAPSKRIIKLFPGYNKPVGGTVGVLGIGLDTIRSECQHFADWLRRLESLS